MLTSAAILALAAIRPIPQYKPLLQAFDKEASRVGFRVVEEAPRFHLVDPTSPKQLLGRVATSGIYRIDMVVALVPDNKTRSWALRSLEATQDAQFSVNAPALDHANLNMFSLGAPPATALDGPIWASSYAAYGDSGHCVVDGTLNKVSDGKPSSSSKKKAIEALASIAAAVAKVASSVPDSAKR